jgi:hypothetical protein
MPGWLDYLFTAPRMVREPVEQLGAVLTEPALDRGPTEAALRGFAAGALEGATDTFLSRAGLAAAALPALRYLQVGRAINPMLGGARGAAAAAAPVAEGAQALASGLGRARGGTSLRALAEVADAAEDQIRRWPGIEAHDIGRTTGDANETLTRLLQWMEDMQPHPPGTPYRKVPPVNIPKAKNPPEVLRDVVR